VFDLIDLSADVLPDPALIEALGSKEPMVEEFVTMREKVVRPKLAVE